MSHRESTPPGIEGEKTTRNGVGGREGKKDDQEGESRKRRRVPRSQRAEKQHSQPHVNTRYTVVNSHRTCLYTNIDSMLNKRSEINALVQLHTPSFIALVEV